MVVSVLALTLVATAAQPASADDASTVTTTEAVQALAATPGVLSASDAVAVTSDADSAAVGSVNGTVVDIPRTASDGVSFKGNGGPAVTVDLPYATAAGDAVLVAPGTVAYPARNGAANAVQATEDGGLRMLTVIDSASAPTTFSYKVEVPGGGRVEVVEGGNAVVLDAVGNVVLAVTAPWAKDADGVAVPTRFEAAPDGQGLVQVVEHRQSGVVYPVTADPSFWGGLGNYLGCIFGVGVPIGLAFGLALVPATWPAVIAWAYQQSATSGRMVITYVNWVYSRCRGYFRG